MMKHRDVIRTVDLRVRLARNVKYIVKTKPVKRVLIVGVVL